MPGATRSVGDALRRFDTEVGKQAMSDLPVELFVERHENGRFSLIERAPGATGERHLPGDLFANPDAIAFYRATALCLAEWANRGVKIEYRDWEGEVEY